MAKISSDGRVEMMCSVVAVFIMAFVVLYMFYSNNFFMRRRMKELGIYSVATLLVSDRLYQTITSGQPEQITVVSINGGTTRSDGTAYTILKDAMPENIYLASAWQRQTEIIQLNSSTYLLIAFATIIFLIATGSICCSFLWVKTELPKATYI